MPSGYSVCDIVLVLGEDFVLTRLLCLRDSIPPVDELNKVSKSPIHVVRRAPISTSCHSGPQLWRQCTFYTVVA